MFKRIFATVLIMIFLGGGFIGCNTIRGIGKDVEKTGEKVQDVAD